MNFKEKITYYQDCINNFLNEVIPSEHKYIGTILSSMRYSLFAGGKRLRPILVLGVGELFDCPLDNVIPYAASIEMIHTYSLIHDDLPAMDNDDYRRGKLTNHKVYNEAIAILAGDGLLNLAFENMLKFALLKGNLKYVKAAYEIANASGIYGMIGGQVVDIENENKVVDGELMEFMHSNKTGALITASVRCGAIIADASEDDILRLSNYAHDLGLAFQIIDDILDVIGDEKKLGKKTGSDLENSKSTYVSMYGLNKAKQIAKELSYSAFKHVEYYGNKGEFLKELTNYLLNREY